MNEKEWLEKYLAPLVGATITGVSVHEDEQGAWPQIQIKAFNGEEHTLEPSMDEEGNGPGFLFGLPIPDQKENHGNED